MMTRGCHIIRITNHNNENRKQHVEGSPIIPSQTRRSGNNITDVCKAPWGPRRTRPLSDLLLTGPRSPKVGAENNHLGPHVDTTVGELTFPGSLRVRVEPLPTVFCCPCQRSPLQTGDHSE